MDQNHNDMDDGVPLSAERSSLRRLASVVGAFVVGATKMRDDVTCKDTPVFNFLL